jgi:hypothetical protein
VHGREALRAHYQGLFVLKDLDFCWTPQRAELFRSGTLGYTSGRYVMSFSRAGKRVTRTGRSIPRSGTRFLPRASRAHPRTRRA